jgi:hypothetical protein
VSARYRLILGSAIVRRSLLISFVVSWAAYAGRMRRVHALITRSRAQG